VNDRDKLAEALGYTHKGDGWWVHPDGMTRYGHPIPENDLNALVAIWPSAWEWEMDRRIYRKGVRYMACALHASDTDFDPITRDGDTEYEARLRLTLAVLEAENTARAEGGKREA
jgi:hypothetical protein